MKSEMIRQHEHTWNVFTNLVSGFDPSAWLHTGRGAITPARLSLHILQCAKFYMQDTVPMQFASGKPFECEWSAVPEEDLPSQADVLGCIEDLQQRTRHWLSQTDFAGENQAFPWAGETKLGAVIFALRHSLYHLGELSSLLNESRGGEVEDNYVAALKAA